MRCILVFIILSFFVPTSWASQALAFKIISRAPQDETLFTQGFDLDQRWFYQSSGLYGKSYLLRFSADDPKNKKRLDVPSNIFAEGITVFQNDLFLVSWKAGTAWRFDSKTLNLEKTFRYSGEGWGLTHNNEHLILSNGTNILSFVSPKTFAPVKTLAVTLNGQALENLNELEFVDGIIWTNQWKSDLLYGIDAMSGVVIYTVDVSALRNEAAVDHIDSVVNGIAYDNEQNSFWITGKYWKHRYMLKFLPPKTSSE